MTTIRLEIRLHVDNTERRIYPGLTAFVTLPMGEERCARENRQELIGNERD